MYGCRSLFNLWVDTMDNSMGWQENIHEQSTFHKSNTLGGSERKTISYFGDKSNQAELGFTKTMEAFEGVKEPTQIQFMKANEPMLKSHGFRSTPWVL